MVYPAVVALDTDETIWRGYLDHTKWGQGAGAHPAVEDNIERVDRSTLQDRTNANNNIRVYDDISKVVHDILDKGAKLAIVSRNRSKAMSDRALYYFNTNNPRENNQEWSIIHLVDYDEVADHSKVGHIRRIQAWSQSDFLDMLMFDDEAFNDVVKVELGTGFHLVSRGKGLDWDTYQEGLRAWERIQQIRIPPQLASTSQPKLIGYSGLSPTWQSRVGRGEGVVDTSMPYRWGYGLYITDTVEMAEYFTGWNDEYDREKSFLCEVWVKDYAKWANLNKIWVPENTGSDLPLMNNLHWSDEESAQNQEDRDRAIAKLGVHTPYVLLSRHHWMHNMPIPEGQRWNEMVVYTQVQRALFEVVRLSDEQIAHAKNTQPSPFPFHDQITEWNITVTKEASIESQHSRVNDVPRLPAQ